VTVVDAFELPPTPAGSLQVAARSTADGGQQLAASRCAAPLPQPADPLAALAPLIAALLQSRAAPPATPAPQWVSVDSAAEYSGLSTRLIVALIKSERLPAMKDGRGWKIRRDDLDALRAPDHRSASGATPDRVAPHRNGGRG
jgi:excisionase family DNA binding protein